MKDVAVVSLLLLSFAVPAGAQTDQVREVLFQIEDDWARAVQQGDVEALRRIIADDYIGTTAAGGVQDKQSYLADFVSGDRNTSLLTTVDLEIRVYGTTAVLTHGGRAEGELRGTGTQGEFRWTHVFLERDGQWQAVANHVTRVQDE